MLDDAIGVLGEWLSGVLRESEPKEALDAHKEFNLVKLAQSLEMMAANIDAQTDRINDIIDRLEL